MKVSTDYAVFNAVVNRNWRLTRRIGLNCFGCACRCTVLNSDRHFFLLFPALRIAIATAWERDFPAFRSVRMFDAMVFFDDPDLRGMELSL